MPPRPKPDAPRNRRTSRPSGSSVRRNSGQNPGPGRSERPSRAPESRGEFRAKSREDLQIEGTSEDPENPRLIRLQKFLAMAGVDSRRNCEEYIRTGRVTVDGEVVTDPARSVDPDQQDVRLDSERLRRPRFRYFLLNKPKGYICTNRDPQGRPRAVDLIPVKDQRLFTVGRLDETTEGMLLVTNDGDLAQRLAHPRFEVIRRYRCHVAGLPSPETLTQLRDGMHFADGFFRFRSIRIFRRKGRSAILDLELQEGKNREIRRLLARVGHKVIALERVAFGPLMLGSLSPGRFRELQPSEVYALRQFIEHGETANTSDRKSRNDGFGYRPGKTRGNRTRKPREIEQPGKPASSRVESSRKESGWAGSNRPESSEKGVEFRGSRRPGESTPKEFEPRSRNRPTGQSPRSERSSASGSAGSRPRRKSPSGGNRPAPPIQKGRDRRRNR